MTHEQELLNLRMHTDLDNECRVCSLQNTDGCHLEECKKSLFSHYRGKAVYSSEDVELVIEQWEDK